jgi:hypothetical protein
VGKLAEMPDVVESIDALYQFFDETEPLDHWTRRRLKLEMESIRDSKRKSRIHPPWTLRTKATEVWQLLPCVPDTIGAFVESTVASTSDRNNKLMEIVSFLQQNGKARSKYVVAHLHPADEDRVDDESNSYEPEAYIKDADEMTIVTEGGDAYRLALWLPFVPRDINPDDASTRHPDALMLLERSLTVSGTVSRGEFMDRWRSLLQSEEETTPSPSVLLDGRSPVTHHSLQSLFFSFATAEDATLTAAMSL